MKTISLILITAVFYVGLYANNKYEDAMQAAMDKFGTASSINELRDAAAQFERIAEAETEEWLPGYYASLIYCIVTFRTEDPQQKETYLKQCQSLVNNAMKIAPEESELFTMQGMIYQAYIGIDPARNGQVYAPKANGAFQVATKLNPKNPRPYYLQALSVMHTPTEYGGGKLAAVPLFEQAMELFSAQTSDQRFYPDWGKEDCEQNLQLCQAEALDTGTSK
jgi:hypothetical protein